ncbi:MAG: transcriptional repressor [Rhodospirillaceae bacterium]|jgi:Fur family zinc uptake transcriptional regulator|nr:transcriptional repressor [Rhodospirillales bacterium]MBT3905432.1 transcriptional repressor [Rhodospirillaceae bacterium]MBT4703501.1 transcriptional repressor [Rhodospirillaceae bacterium]MBT5034630.1 transcriptional repressor [Rhodospirillaceae bacterium]MBT6220474.1 transcriptional repressor [Rhodospirillaceae bacterium]
MASRLNPVLAPFPADKHDHGACIEDAITIAEEICTRDGTALTELRRRVLELVWEGHRPVGAYDLLEKLQRERRKAAPPTVYRALDFLMENGLIHKIESLNAFVGCGAPTQRHGGQFLICQACGAVAELNDATVTRRISTKAADLGFEVESQMVEVLGTCPDCAGQRKADA